MITATLQEHKPLQASVKAPGKDGGYYIPYVEDGVISWTPSKDNMPEAPSADIFTAAVKEDLVAEVLAALPDGDEVAY